MSMTAKASPGIAVPGLAVENGNVCETVQPSTKDFITLAAKRQSFRVADLLLHGSENAIPLKHLEELAGLPGREVRRLIQAERLGGVPILSNCVGGYFLPGDSAERDRCVRSLRR